MGANAISTFKLELKSGWPDLCGATLGLACGVGLYTPISSMFFRALEIEFHWSKTAIVIALVALPITAVFLPVAGRLADRFGVRSVAGTSAVLMAAIFLALSAIGGSLAEFYAGFIAFNVLGCATGPISYTRPVAQRFVASRGTAVAIALSGIAISGVILPVLLGPILAQGGWRAGYRLIAVVALVGGVVAVLLIRSSGRQYARREAQGLTRSQAVKTGAFWCLGIAIFAVSAASVGFVSQLQSVALEFGVAIRQTTILLSVVSLSVLPSRLLSGWALDALPPERVAAAFLLLSSVGLALWLASPGPFVNALAGSILLGVSLGSEHAFMSFFCAKRFGLRAYSAIFGVLAVFLYLGMAAGGLLFAMVHDRTASYAGAIYASIGLMVTSAVLFLKLPRTSIPPDPTSQGSSTHSAAAA
jgi:predicted MFS family arabinose efflux permease